MKFKDDINYCILSNKIDQAFLNTFDNITVIGEMSFDDLKKKLEFFPSKQVAFNNTWHNLSKNEITQIIELLSKQNIKFINITSNVEETIYADYIKVCDGDELVLDGKKEEVLKEEKTLKKLGYGLPFVVDLSLQLNYYNILDKIYYDMTSLEEALWN